MGMALRVAIALHSGENKLQPGVAGAIALGYAVGIYSAPRFYGALSRRNLLEGLQDDLRSKKKSARPLVLFTPSRTPPIIQECNEQNTSWPFGSSRSSSKVSISMPAP